MKHSLQKIWFLLPIIMLTAAFMGTVILLHQSNKTNKQNSELLSAPTTLEESCPGAKLNDEACQKKYFEKKYQSGGTEVAFDEIKKEYAQNSSVKANCHQLVHVIGRAAALKYDDVAKAYENGNNFCWSGYYHGVMEGLLKKLGSTDLSSQLNNICKGVSNQKDRYSFKHYNCAHGIGHGIMLIEADELFVSLASCDKLKDSWERQSCYGGVYMENIMANINPDHSTKYLKDDDPLYPCTAVGEKYRNQCYQMQTSHALRILGNDFNKVFALCSGIPPNNQTACYQSVGRDASGNSISDPVKTHTICAQGPNEVAREGCVVGAVKDFISYHHKDTEATTLCEMFEPNMKTLCNQTKKEYYKNF